MAEQYMPTSFTLPRHLVERLDRVAEARNKSRSAMARDLLGFALDHTALEDEVQALRAELGSIKEQVAGLRRKVEGDA